ncbi:MAG: aspartate carbamoyltransferase catalytic subunit [Clostridia bacterium]|nr:aspartate carbamoyltransferase catalytic subunit [Clostridia bacterium]
MLSGRKDLLGIQELSREDILYILDKATEMKKVVLSDNKKIPNMQGKSLITLFYENSTRTRTSFELASKYMGASSANIAASGSSIQKGESLIDTGKTLDSMGTDVIVIRHSASGAPHLLAKNVKASVVNAGDGMNEHPTQALLDMFTIREKKGSFEGLKVAIIGDVTHSRVARSDTYALTKLGAQVFIAGPPTLLPLDFEKLGNVTICESVEEAICDADVIINLRIQLERMKSALFPTVREYSEFFGMSLDKMKFAKDDVLIMHPGPVNRGIEISSYVADCENSVINEQVTNGVSVRMAVLDILCNE